MKIKQIISNLLIVTILLSTLVGCGSTNQIEPNSETTENIVTETEISETTTTETQEKDWSKEYENYFVKNPIDLYHSTLEGFVEEEGMQVSIKLSYFEDKSYMSLSSTYEDKNATFEMYDMNDNLLYSCLTFMDKSTWNKLEKSTEVLEEEIDSISYISIGLSDSLLYNTNYLKEEIIDNVTYDILSTTTTNYDSFEENGYPVYVDNEIILYLFDGVELTNDDITYSLDENKNILANGEIYQTYEETIEKEQITYLYYINRETQSLYKIVAENSTKQQMELYITPCTTIILPATASYAEETDPLTLSFSMMTVFLLPYIDDEGNITSFEFNE